MKFMWITLVCLCVLLTSCVSSKIERDEVHGCYLNYLMTKGGEK